MTLRAARASYLVAAGLLATSYYALPATRPVTTALIGALAVGAIVFSAVRQRPERWRGWALVAVAVATVTVGEVAFAIAIAYNPTPGVYPGTQDIFFLLSYGPLALGLVALGRPALRSRDWSMLLDVIALALAGSLVAWLVVVRPAIASYDLTTLGRLTVLASWVGFTAVLAAGVRVALEWYRVAALRWLSLGALAFLLADFLYGRFLLNGTITTGGAADAAYHSFALCCGLAALSPSMTTVVSQTTGSMRLSVLRIGILGLATLVAPTALLAEASLGPVTTGVAIALVTAGVGIAVLIRLAISINDHRRRATRLHAIRTASRDLAGAATERDVTESVRTALKSMLPPDTRHDVCITNGPAHHDFAPMAGGAEPAEGSDGTDARLTIPMPAEAPIAGSQQGPLHRAAVRSMQFIAPKADLAELARALHAITEHAGSAIERIDLVAKLRADERERYFRTLVLTSRDVTMISRAGRIDYATPSAQDLFGREVRGERFEDVVRLPSTHVANDGGVETNGNEEPTSDGEVEGCVQRPDGTTLTVLVRERDLTADPTVSGVVTTVRDVTEERTLQRHLAYRASHDPLTGLANADAFQDRLNAPPHPQRRGKAALFVDLDDFKMINDTYGHEVGDRLLEVVARRIESCLRADDVAARMGGDEFAVLLTQVPNEDAARAVAQRIADALAEPAVIDGVGLNCQASIGLSYGPTSSTTLLREADAALYTAKAAGKGRWSQYKQGMTTPTRSHVNARQRIERAMSAGTLTLHYQPIVDLVTGDATGYEALVRLDDDQRPMTPQEVIQVADDTGIVAELGAWTIRQALKDVPRLNARPGQSRYVSVNVSARQLRQPDFVDMVRAAVRDGGADPTMLMLEVTEELVVGNEYDRAWDFLSELRKDGTRIAIDDYGTGYASLSYLRQPSLDLVKIDRSFVAAAMELRGQLLLRHVARLCVELGLELVAKGVRDTKTRDTLLDLGCTHGQGHLYARAMAVEDAAHWRFIR